MRARAAVVTVALAVATVVPAANAAAVGQHAGVQQHCVVDVVGQADDGELIMGTERCFETFAEVTSYASGGDVLLPADMGPSEFAASSVAAVSSYAIGIHYTGRYGTGSSITVVGSSCTGGWWHPPVWMRYDMSSTHNGCPKIEHRTGTDGTGFASTTYGVGSTSNLNSAVENNVGTVKYLP
ncbi:MAG: hypothetical protein ABFR95_04170 [Actinomycetota bacterium]